MAKTTKKTARKGPRKHHLDRFAFRIIAEAPADDAQLTPPEEASWLRVSLQWLADARCQGYGPPFERLGPGLIRYRAGKTREWLEERTHRSTSEYAEENGKARKGARASKAARAARAAR